MPGIRVGLGPSPLFWGRPTGWRHSRFSAPIQHYKRTGLSGAVPARAVTGRSFFGPNRPTSRPFRASQNAPGHPRKPTLPSRPGRPEFFRGWRMAVCGSGGSAPPRPTRSFPGLANGGLRLGGSGSPRPTMSFPGLRMAVCHSRLGGSGTPRQTSIFPSLGMAVCRSRRRARGPRAEAVGKACREKGFFDTE